ncbi:GNAT family N-acetyltransferase, partial [Streptomyces hainanensis]
DGRLVGFVNVAWDGGAHAFLLDTVVASDHRRLGIAARLVAVAHLSWPLRPSRTSPRGTR